MLSEYQKLVYADGRYNDNTLLCAYLKSILLLQEFFLKLFYCLCIFCLCFFLVLFFFSFLSFFFFVSLHIMKSREKKNNIKNNNNLQTGRTNTLLCQSFTDYHLKRALSLPVIYKSTFKCTLCTKQIIFRLFVCLC